MRMYENGTGLLRQKEDKRDKAFSAVAPFDWDLGVDIQLILGFRSICRSESEFYGPRGRANWGVDRYKEILDIVKKKNIKPLIIDPSNQGGSYSCTGQGLAKYLSVLNYLETGIWVEISARDIYAYISLGYGKGAYLRDALKLVCKRGAGPESHVPSYISFQTDFGTRKEPMSETEMLVKPEETAALKAIRTALSAKDYRICDSPRSERMDRMAWAILMGFGCYFGVTGENNGTWMSTWPKLPTVDAWGHALYAGKALIRDGKRCIGHLNSWGNGCGENGWQYLTEEYIAAGVGPEDVDAVFNPWTLTDKPNQSSMPNPNVKILKDTNSAAVGFFIPAISEEALKSLYFTLLGQEVPKDDKGVTDWDSLIQGTFTLKQEEKSG